MFRANRLFNFIKLTCLPQRFESAIPIVNTTITPSINNVLELLKSRSLLRVSGTEASDFLQGLITNDMKHLENGPGAMYSMVLNTKGRVLYDAIVYRTQEESTYYIECDTAVIEQLAKHLKIYRVRRKINIDNMDNCRSVYVVFNPLVEIPAEEESKSVSDVLIPDSKASCKVHRDIIIYKDPRVPALGARILAPHTCDVKHQLAQFLNVDYSGTSSENYRKLRFSLGIGEGVTDLPPGECFPLEANCDYLHGVSFHKGCYIGQELTARTYHTGVVRKRLMPLIFSKVPTKFPEENKIFLDKTNIGKFRGLQGNYGLALLRIAQAIHCESIPIGDGVAQTIRPSWWPLEAPKEKISAQQKML